jgi:hypothetical protein
MLKSFKLPFGRWEPMGGVFIRLRRGFRPFCRSIVCAIGLSLALGAAEAARLR